MRAHRASWIALVLTLVCAATTSAQHPTGGARPSAPGVISGSVANAESKPLATAGITLRSAGDSTLLTGVMTDERGRFRIEGLLAGDYLLRVSLIGYLPRNSEVISLTTQSPTVDLGVIGLELTPVELTGVEAAVERSQIVVEGDPAGEVERQMRDGGAENAPRPPSPGSPSSAVNRAATARAFTRFPRALRHPT